MTTLQLSIAGPANPGTSHELEVTEGFDRVLDLVIPLTQASSALEARSRVILTLGARVGLHVGELVRRPDARQNFRPLTLITAERSGSGLLAQSIVAGDVNGAAARLTQELAA